MLKLQIYDWKHATSYTYQYIYIVQIGSLTFPPYENKNGLWETTKENNSN